MPSLNSLHDWQQKVPDKTGKLHVEDVLHHKWRLSGPKRFMLAYYMDSCILQAYLWTVMNIIKPSLAN